jgi:Icc-related predicted phosphoesterase
MKIRLLSDLHLSVQPFVPPAADADVVVLAGDLGRPAAAMAWTLEHFGSGDRPTLFVAGNHEFYGTDLSTAMAELRRLAAGTNVRVLEREGCVIGGVRFLGCTLWSDQRLYASPEARAHGLHEAQRLVGDFSRIRIAPDFDAPFHPALAQLLCEQSVAWLEARFAEPFDGPTVVVTHFAPSPQSIAARFAGSPINACFVSDLEARLLHWQPALWLHGHVHDSFDYRIGGTRVVCNPRGYAPRGVIENAAFKPDLVVEVAGS